MRITLATLGALLIGWLLVACAETPDRDVDQTPDQPERETVSAGPSGSGGSAAARPAKTQGRSRAGKRGSGRPIDEYAAESRLRNQAAKAMGESEFLTGKKLYEELRYADAERRLLVALEKDPNHEEAQRLLRKTQFILGKREGEIPSVVEILTRETEVRIQEFQIELERTMNQGTKLFNEMQYDKAAKKFSYALEQIEYFPFFVDTSDHKRQAEHWLGESKDKQRDKERRIRRQVQQAAETQARRGRMLNLRRVQRRISDLMTKAADAYDMEEYEKCEVICDEIIEVDHRHRGAGKLRDKAIQARHVKKALDNIRDRIEHFRGQIVGVKTSSVPYQQIFRWPSKEEWAAINLRSQGLDRFFSPDETPETIRIREKLEVQRITLNFDETAFVHAVDFLKDVTGLNFVISSQAEEIIDGEDGLNVTLKVKDLPLKNAMTLILDHNPDLRYSIRNDVVFITTLEDVQEEMYLEFYNVSDIIGKIPDFPAPKLALAPLPSGGIGGGGTGVLSFDDDDDDDTKGIGVDIDTLIQLIEENLGEEADEASVEASPGGILVVRHTIEAHRKIRQLLESLRKTVGIMVTVEARFVDIQDNFLENLGIDYRGLPAQILNVDGSGTNQNIGYRFVDSQQQNDTRAAIVNTFSTGLGSSSSNPFNFFETGGAAVQYNLLEHFQLQAVFEAVKKTQKARIVNNPRITVFNTQRSHVLIVNQEAYIADTEINQTGITPVLNPVIGILNSGSILEARPTVSHDRKYVTLEVQPTLAVDLTTPLNVANLSLGAGGLFGVGQAGTQIPIELPVLRVEKIRTTVTVPDGGTVIVGGLRGLRRVKNYAGVPILGHIPGIRLLFSRRGESSLKRSLVVLLKADITIVREEEEKLYNPRF